MGRIAVVVLLLVASVTVSVATRQAPSQAVPRFKTGVELVVLDVSVLDAERRPVRGLNASDFIVLEDGRSQAVASFSAVDLPDVVEDTVSTAPWVRTVAPDVRRNSDVKDRRIVVLVLDDSTPMPAEDVPRVKMMVRQVVERLGPNDLTAVVYTSSQRHGQDFTTDKARLLAAVDRFNGAFDKQAVLGSYNADPLQPTARTMSFDEYNPAALTLYSSVVSTLRSLSEYLADLPERRKALIFASVGLPLDVEAAKPTLLSPMPGESLNQDMQGGAKSLFEGLEKTFGAAQRANVNIYSLDPGGLRAPAGQYDAYAGRGSMARNPGNLNRDFLHAVADNTGGFTIADTNRMDEGITQILRENASYYLVGYAPANQRAEGRYRRLEVKVNRPGVTVRARTGYFEPRPAAASKTVAVKPSPAAAALAGILPRTDLAMAVVTAPFAVPGQRDAALAIVLGIQRPAPARAVRINDRMDVQVAVYAPGGQQRAATHQVIPVGVNTSGLGGTIGYELLLRLDVPPGRYQLRVAAERSPQGDNAANDDAPGRSGSVYADLDVPDFGTEALSLSGLALSVTPPVVSGPKGTLASVMPIVPTTLRDFGPDDRVTAFVQVYEGGNRPVAPVTLAIRIVDAKGTVVFDKSETMGADRFAQARAGDLRFDVPIAPLPRGPYLLSVEATSANTTTRREVRFAVR